MTDTQKRLGWFFATLAFGMFASMGIAVAVSITVSRDFVQQTIDRQKAAGEAGRRASCFLIKTIGDAYEAEPPSSPTGERVVKAWRDLAVAFGCKED